MTGMEWILIAMVLLFGFFMAWNIGANDVANAMGTSVGSRALTLKQAVILAGIFEFLGAFIVGANVSDTVRKKLFDPMLLKEVYPAAEYGEGHAALILACGMIAALMAAARAAKTSRLTRAKRSGCTASSVSTRYERSSRQALSGSSSGAWALLGATAQMARTVVSAVAAMRCIHT